MAKDAVSASILKSNLDLLKREGSELLSLFDDVNKKAASLGTNMSSSVRSVVGEINRLESSLSGLQSRLQRLTSTGSAIGAANISGALGQLTGQGRSYGGGGAYGGGAAPPGMPMSNALFNRGFGSAVGNVLAGGVGTTGSKISRYIGATSPKGKAGKVLKFLGMGATDATTAAAKQAAKLAGAGIDMSTGMGMAALGQIYGTGMSAERAMLYGAGRGAKSNRFGKFGKYGIGGLEAYGYEQAFQQAGGYLGKGYSDNIAGTVSRGQAAGFDPRQGLGLLASQRALGGTGEVALQRLTQAISTLQGVVKDRYGAAPDSGEARAYGKELGPYLVQAVAALSNMQAMQGAGNQSASGARSLGLVAALTKNFSPQQAANIAGALGQSTFSPGGGEAGQLFQMRAYGFGNPNLGAYQDMAKKMGVDPSMFKRRGFFEYQRFKEGDMTSKIQAMLVGMGVEGRGNPEFQAQMLKSVAGVSFTQAEALVGMGRQGNLGRSAIEEILARRGKVGSDASFGLGEIAAGLEGKRLGAAGKSATGLESIAAAMASLQSVQYKAVTGGVTSIAKSFDDLAKVFSDNDQFITVGMKATVEMTRLLIKAMSKASGGLNK